MKKATMVATTIIVAMMIFSFSVLAVPPTNDQLGAGMLVIGTQIGTMKDDIDGLKDRPVGVSRTYTDKADNILRGEIQKGDAETKKLAQLAVDKVNGFRWDSPEAQMAIQRWVEVHMFGGKKLEDIMGKDPKTGKVNTDAVALLDISYAPISLVKSVEGMSNNVSSLVDLVKKAQELAGKNVELSNGLVSTVKDLSETVVNPLVKRVDTIESTMPTDRSGNFLKLASITEVDTLSAKVDGIDAKVDMTQKDLDNVRALALKRDKALVTTYAAYVMRYGYEKGESEFKKWLAPQLSGKNEEEFNKVFNHIKANAEKALADGKIKY